MNKYAIEKFAKTARKKLIASVTDKAGMFGITKDGCNQAVTKGTDFEIYISTSGTETTLNKKQCEQRRKLVEQVNSQGFDTVIEEIAYTWFNRICAIRFMEVNDYMYPERVRILSSEKAGKNEPDVLTMAPDIDWNFSDEEKELIVEYKLNNQLDELFMMLFIKQCNLLHEVLPDLFEETQDYSEMLLNISFTNQEDVIRMLVDEVDEKDFNVNELDEYGNPTGQVEIIGWLYQYYNSEVKADTFANIKKNIKISKERVPAATQLFTPDWIVRYMVENSIGRKWIYHMKSIDEKVDEEEISRKFGWKYYIPSNNVDNLSEFISLKPQELTCIDPCMGSGHILVTMFDILMDIYESAGYEKREAVFEIIEHNLYGIDIDRRAYQLAYFAVMMKGRAYNRRFFSGRKNEEGQVVNARPNVYVSEESNDINRVHVNYIAQTAKIDNKDVLKKQLNELLSELHNATEYGSVLYTSEYEWEKLKSYVMSGHNFEQMTLDTVGLDETINKLLRLIELSKRLNDKYEVVVTNPPYMGNFTEKMMDYVLPRYPESKYDLYTVMFTVFALHHLKKNGFIAFVTGDSWMFTDSFTTFREQLIHNYSMINLLHLGANAFDAGFGTVAYVCSKSLYPNMKGTFYDLTQFDGSVKQAQEYLKTAEKEYELHQKVFLEMDDSRIAYRLPEPCFALFKDKKVGDYCTAKAGVVSGKDKFFVKMWYEVDYKEICFSSNSGDSYEKYHTFKNGGGNNRYYGNNYYVLRLNALYDSQFYNKSIRRGDPEYYFKKCITWSKVGNQYRRFTTCNNCVCGTASPAIYLKDDTMYFYILAFLNSKVAKRIIDSFNPTMNLQATDVSDLPLLISEHKKAIEDMAYENFLFAKSDWDTQETSWDFKINPIVEMKKNGVGDGNIEELCLRWLSDRKEEYLKFKSNEEEINRLFIKLYGLDEELDEHIDDRYMTFEVPEIKIIIENLLSYAVGCIEGRYSIDSPGVCYTNKGICEEKYISFKPDDDGIIPVTEEEYFKDDIVDQLCSWIKDVFGTQYYEHNITFIAEVLEKKGDSVRSKIREYFLNGFIDYHNKMYQKAPIYWMFDAGKGNGFKAIIYVHRYFVDTVGKVRTDYLHKTQKAIEAAYERAEYIKDTAASNTEKSKAMKDMTKYTKQLQQLRLYDEAIAHMANKRIEINLDEGIKSNYEVFQNIEVSQEGKKTEKINLLYKM